MGIFHSSTRFWASKPQDEEEGESRAAYPKLQNHHPSGDSSTQLIYKALRKVYFLFNFLRPTKTADPLLPIRNPASSEPLLVPTPRICSRRIIHDSSAHSIFKITSDQSLTDGKEAQFENVGRVSCSRENHSADRNYMDGKLVVCSNALIKSINAVVDDEERKIKHYSSRHKILLVGEGDFSFSACLAVAFGSAANIIATSLNSREFLKKHYGNALSNIAELRSRGAKVMHGIDATKLTKHKFLRQVKYDRVIFNFPHAGFSNKMSSECQLRRHRRLVSLFLKKAREMISENGEIHISHKTNGFHTKFNLEIIACSHSLRLIEAVKFKNCDYEGYNTKYGFGGDGNFNCDPSRTFKFGLQTAPL